MPETPMAERYQLRRSQFVARPVSEVFDFFAAPENLQILTPPFLNFRILTPSPIPMQVGTLIDYKLSLFGFPMKWRTRIEAYEPGRSFIDVAIKSPYRLWHHLHTFAAVPGGTQMEDVVDYELPLGPLGLVAHGLMVKRTLKRIFDFRTQAVQERFAWTRSP
jgi:ligand-binding SRPBCC domain-containing protein